MWKLILIAYWAACFTITHVPPSQVPSVSVPHVDKLVHFSMYLLLSILFSISFPKLGIKAFLVLLFYIAIDELSQPYFLRDAELLDGVADSLGSILGIFIVMYWPKRRGLVPA